MTDIEQPNPEDFSVNERPGEFNVTFSVRGTIRTTIKADSLEDARAKAREMAEFEEFGIELDEADDVEIDLVSKSPVMYRVLRDGKTMQVSRLAPGDLPRQPDERGF
jgi:hypothetical protein